MAVLLAGRISGITELPASITENAARQHLIWYERPIRALRGVADSGRSLPPPCRSGHGWRRLGLPHTGRGS